MTTLRVGRVRPQPLGDGASRHPRRNVEGDANWTANNGSAGESESGVIALLAIEARETPATCRRAICAMTKATAGCTR